MDEPEYPEEIRNRVKKRNNKLEVQTEQSLVKPSGRILKATQERVFYYI
jgi:hypothetical protein